MSKQFFLPESMYDIDSNMTLEKLSFCLENRESLTGKVIRLNPIEKYLEVDLGGGIISKMPFYESSIYPVYNNVNALSPNVYTLINKKIRVQIISTDYHDIQISRKANMLLALEYLKDKTYIYSCEIIGFSILDAFVDIGGGILGKICAKDYAPVKFNNIRDIGLSVGDIIPVKILNYESEKNRFNLSRRATLPQACEVLNKNDLVICNIFDPVNDAQKIGYYTLVTKYGISGIIDSKYEKLKYGDKVLAAIKQITPKGPRLELVRKF